MHCTVLFQVMHDPFSMRPFFGYNFGDYIQHWLQLGRWGWLSVSFIIVITAKKT